MDLREFYFLESSDDEMDEVLNEDDSDIEESAQCIQTTRSEKCLMGRMKMARTSLTWRTMRPRMLNSTRWQPPCRYRLAFALHLSTKAAFRHIINGAALAVYAYAGLQDQFARSVVGCLALGALLIIAVVRATTSSAAVDVIPNTSQSLVHCACEENNEEKD
ncbi:hypothetical protein PRIPAC_92426 [Pristionchus pacificus]|uniref:Uncharacterized protein n=1 Tax=Pristionchus pacificus TaxID=54126 RepID=A0A2A6CD12_PRIPA|nr:hypothetical protein PRIPAC_92426 [Pristionchus pacificus]|eukprot:PDM75988.1 hypothetical protein PRIPAC_39592 [Pristionchus pacificus]